MHRCVQVAVDRSLTLYPTCRWHVYLTMGLTTTLNGVGGSFASLPSRTAPYLQGILATIIIPFTVLCRFLLLRKGLYSTAHVHIVCPEHTASV